MYILFAPFKQLTGAFSKLAFLHTLIRLPHIKFFQNLAFMGAHKYQTPFNLRGRGWIPPLVTSGEVHMSNCIFCNDDLDAATKPEHIILNALGGRKTTKTVICSDCNNQFGSKIDSELAKSVEFIRLALQQRSGSGKPPPSIKGIPSAIGTVDFRPDGRPVLNSNPFEITLNEDGTRSVQVTARDPEHLESLMPHMAKQLGLTQAELKEKLAGHKLKLIKQRPPELQIPLRVGGQTSSRSIMKSCLCLWADRVGNDELKKPVYGDALDFVRVGGDELNGSIVNIDSRTLPNSAYLSSMYGDFFHFLYVESDHVGKVIGHFTLYNIVSWQFLLANEGGKPNSKAVIASNPQNSATWSDKITDEISLNIDWLSSPQYDPMQAKQRLCSLLEYHYIRTRNLEYGEIVSSVCKKYGIMSDDQPIPAEMQELIVAEVAAQVAAHAVSVPHTEEIPIHEWQKD